MKTLHCAALAAGIGLVIGGSGMAWKAATAQPHAAIQPAPTGKITPWAAMKAAQGKVPGRPLQAIFEFEDGKWIYGVLIVSDKTLKEVSVDANTGKAGAVETMTPDEEAKEVREELLKATGGKASAAETKEADEKDEKGEKPE